MLVRLLAVVAAVAVAGSAYLLVQMPVAPPPPAAAAPEASEASETSEASEPVAAAPSEPAAPTQRPRSRPAPARVPKNPPPVPTTSPSPPPPPAPVQQSQGTAELRAAARLARLAQRAVGGHLGIAVFDGNGAAVFGSNASTPVLPASTQKLAVAGAALARFGPQHRYTTTVTTTASPNKRGVLKGDVVIVGGGDPALAQPDFGAIEPDRPRTPLERLAIGIKRAGIRRIKGRLLADPRFLAHEPVAVGWPPRYFDYLDATRITGLTVDAGRRIYRSGGLLQAEAADDPAVQSAVVLRRLLRERGVTVSGGTGLVGQTQPAGATIASVNSPPLGVMLRYMVQSSDNHLADTIFRTLGASTGNSTWVGAAAATAQFLAPLQLDWSGVVLADGSGLSRANRVSPAFLAQLQSHLWSSNLREQWVGLLAVAGRTGTLRSRLVGTVAEQRVFGKTGSLRDVSALVGTVAGTEGRLLHFAIIGNGLQSATRMREVTDASVLAMAEEIQDCRRVVRPPRVRGKGKHRTVKRFPPRLVCG